MSDNEEKISGRVRNLYLLAGEHAVDDPIFLALSDEERSQFARVIADTSHSIHDERLAVLSRSRSIGNLSEAEEAAISRVLDLDHEHKLKMMGMKEEQVDEYLSSGSLGYVHLNEKELLAKRRWLKSCWKQDKGESFLVLIFVPLGVLLIFYMVWLS